MAQQTEFSPRSHGYQFQDVSAAGFGPGVLSGGMAWSALDWFHHRSSRRPPGYDAESFPGGVLVRGASTAVGAPTLLDYIVRRQGDSVVTNCAVNAVPENNVEVALLVALLDSKLPTPLVHAGDATPAHHVVAFAHQWVNGLREIVVYDPAVERDVLLRVVAKDKVERFTAHQVGNGPWVEESQLPTIKGLWVAKGYTPQSPDTVEDMFLLGGIVAPAAVAADAKFEVSFEVVNWGEFESTPVFQTGLLVDDVVVASNPHGSIYGLGRALLDQRISSAFEIEIADEGEHTLEAVYWVKDHGPGRYRRFGSPFTIVVLASVKPTSYLVTGSSTAGPRVTAVLGNKVSGPTLLNPNVPNVYEVAAYKAGIVVWVEDQYNAGSFAEPMKALACKLDDGLLQSESTAFRDPRTATYAASYAPVAGKTATVLRIVATDANGVSIDTSLAVPCAGTVSLPARPMGTPDFDPFHEPPRRMPPLSVPRERARERIAKRRR